MRQPLADQLRELGQRGILIKAAERGDITELACKMDECLHPRGREYFDKKSHPPSDWAPSVDHYPRLQKDGGHLELGNVRLAHVLCNRVDYAKNHGIKHEKDHAKSRRSQSQWTSPEVVSGFTGRDGSGLVGVADAAEQSLAVWQEARREVPEVVVRPAIPILYFGDLDAYLGSQMRILTVGLNPSREEFPREHPSRRFPLAEMGNTLDVSRYLESLNEYFRRVPYRSWFATFEPILQGAGASYYTGAGSTALHTDLCSPVATNPTWNKLKTPQKELLIKRGRPLWHELVRALLPDVLLVSVAESHLDSVKFERIGDPWELFRLERSNPYSVTAVRVRLTEQKRALLVFGRAAQRPFGTIDSAAKQAAGRRISEALDG